MRYRVRALGANASVVETELEAGCEADVRAQAEARGLSVLSLKALERGRGGGRFPLLLFNQQLLALLRAGIPLSEAISALMEKERWPAIRSVLQGMRDALREGRSLSSALESAPQAFPALYVALIRAAERTSDLERAIARYISYQEDGDRLRDKLVSAAIYPLLLVGVGSLVVLFLLGYVVPRFSHIYQNVGSNLPWMSRLLLEWGQFVEGHALLLVAIFAAMLAGGALVVRSRALWATVGRYMWKMPFIGERMRVFQLARFYRTVGMLLSGGIPVVTALGMVSGLLSPPLQAGLAAAIAAIREGRSFSSMLAARGLTTPVALRMLEVGEHAGNLGEMLSRAAEFHEEDTARQVEWLTRLFGPLLMLLIGCAIGLIVVLMYIPIFLLAESIR
ncbi:Type II secretion system protein F [Azoarcus sp. Aa7]|nr:Type II secretion system protein F [Azoarcus sp. Aa7]